MNLEDTRKELNAFINSYFKDENTKNGGARYFDKEFITKEMFTRENANAVYKILKEAFTPPGRRSNKEEDE